MTRRLVAAVAILCAACGGQMPAGHPAGLMVGLGAHHHPIVTAQPDAQRFFDQGFTEAGACAGLRAGDDCGGHIVISFHPKKRVAASAGISTPVVWARCSTAHQ